jgi:DNA-directed RNA polymerase subunit beta'
VTDPGMTPLQKAQLLTEDDYLNKVEEYGDEFSAAMGAEGVRDLLASLDLQQEMERCAKIWKTPVPMPRSKRSPSV